MVYGQTSEPPAGGLFSSCGERKPSVRGEPTPPPRAGRADPPRAGSFAALEVSLSAVAPCDGGDARADAAAG